MAKINLLPWLDELREQRKKQFIAICVGVALLGLASVLLTWLYFDHKLKDQEQANQLITSTNQGLDVQLKSLEGLQKQRDDIVERMKLIKGLDGQRPISVHLVEELVRVVPDKMFITKFSRTGDNFVIEGKAESPSTVAELLTRLGSSPYFRKAFMSSFLAAEENKNKTATSIVPREEEAFGSFIVTVALGEAGVVAVSDSQEASAVAASAGGAK